MNSNELCTFQKRLLIIVPAYELLLHFSTVVLDQLVFHLYYSWCWSTLHVSLTLQWLQYCSTLQHNIRVYDRHYSWCWSTLHVSLTLQWIQFCSLLQLDVRVFHPNDFVYLHRLRSAGAIEWRQFCCILLQTRVPYDHAHQYNQLALLLSAFFQPYWRHHHSLHNGIVWRDAHQFLWKEQLNQNSLMFAKHSITLFNQLLPLIHNFFGNVDT